MKAASLIWLPMALACAGDTGSGRFSFEARAGGSEFAGTPYTFDNALGWTITLTQAEVTLGPVYLNVIPPLRSAAQGWIDWFIRPAYAQTADHLDAGRIVGEVLGQVTFSALSSELVAFPVRGSLTQEEVRTAEVWFYPAPGTSAEATRIGTPALRVSGEATRGDDDVRFQGAVVLDDAWLLDQPAGTRGSPSIVEIRKVRGIPTSFLPHEGGHLELRLDIQRLFRGADFSQLATNPVAPDGTTQLVQAKAGRDQVMTNLYQGLRDASATYTASWVDP